MSTTYLSSVLISDNVSQLTLEWSTLSKYTNNPRYRELTENAVKHIAGLTGPLPGLAAQGIDPASGEFVGSYVVCLAVLSR